MLYFVLLLGTSMKSMATVMKGHTASSLYSPIRSLETALRLFLMLDKPQVPQLHMLQLLNYPHILVESPSLISSFYWK